jgi:LCP family protein required for cell wall assembly
LTPADAETGSSETAPFEPAPLETSSFEPTSFEPAPLGTAPLESTSFETGSFEPIPFEPAPLEFEPVPLEPTSFAPAPSETGSVEPTSSASSLDATAASSSDFLGDSLHQTGPTVTDPTEAGLDPDTPSRDVWSGAVGPPVVGPEAAADPTFAATPAFSSLGPLPAGDAESAPAIDPEAIFAPDPILTPDPTVPPDSIPRRGPILTAGPVPPTFLFPAPVALPAETDLGPALAAPTDLDQPPEPWTTTAANDFSHLPEFWTPTAPASVPPLPSSESLVPERPDWSAADAPVFPPLSTADPTAVVSPIDLGSAGPGRFEAAAAEFPPPGLDPIPLHSIGLSPTESELPPFPPAQSDPARFDPARLTPAEPPLPRFGPIVPMADRLTAGQSAPPPDLEQPAPEPFPTAPSGDSIWPSTTPAQDPTTPVDDPIWAPTTPSGTAADQPSPADSGEDRPTVSDSPGPPSWAQDWQAAAVHTSQVWQDPRPPREESWSDRSAPPPTAAGPTEPTAPADPSPTDGWTTSSTVPGPGAWTPSHVADSGRPWIGAPSDAPDPTFPGPAGGPPAWTPSDTPSPTGPTFLGPAWPDRPTSLATTAPAGLADAPSPAADLAEAFPGQPSDPALARPFPSSADATPPPASADRPTDPTSFFRPVPDRTAPIATAPGLFDPVPTGIAPPTVGLDPADHADSSASSVWARSFEPPIGGTDGTTEPETADRLNQPEIGTSHHAADQSDLAPGDALWRRLSQPWPDRPDRSGASVTPPTVDGPGHSTAPDALVDSWTGDDEAWAGIEAELPPTDWTYLPPDPADPLAEAGQVATWPPVWSEPISSTGRPETTSDPAPPSQISHLGSTDPAVVAPEPAPASLFDPVGPLDQADPLDQAGLVGPAAGAGIDRFAPPEPLPADSSAGLAEPIWSDPSTDLTEPGPAEPSSGLTEPGPADHSSGLPEPLWTDAPASSVGPTPQETVPGLDRLPSRQRSAWERPDPDWDGPAHSAASPTAEADLASPDDDGAAAPAIESSVWTDSTGSTDWIDQTAGDDRFLSADPTLADHHWDEATAEATWSDPAEADPTAAPAPPGLDSSSPLAVVPPTDRTDAVSAAADRFDSDSIDPWPTLAAPPASGAMAATPDPSWDPAQARQAVGTTSDRDGSEVPDRSAGSDHALEPDSAVIPDRASGADSIADSEPPDTGGPRPLDGLDPRPDPTADPEPPATPPDWAEPDQPQPSADPTSEPSSRTEPDQLQFLDAPAPESSSPSESAPGEADAPLRTGFYPSDEDLLEQALAARQTDLDSRGGPKRALVEPRLSRRERRAKNKRDQKARAQRLTAGPDGPEAEPMAEAGDQSPSTPAVEEAASLIAVEPSPQPGSTVSPDSDQDGPVDSDLQPDPTAADASPVGRGPDGSDDPDPLADPTGSDLLTAPTSSSPLSPLDDQDGSDPAIEPGGPTRPTEPDRSDSPIEPDHSTRPSEPDDSTDPAPPTEPGPEPDSEPDRLRSATSPTEPVGQRAGRQAKPKRPSPLRPSSTPPSRAASDRPVGAKAGLKPPRVVTPPSPPSDNLVWALVVRLVPGLGLRQVGFKKLSWLAWSVLPVLLAGAAWLFLSPSARLHLFFSAGTLKLALVALVVLALAWTAALILIQRGVRPGRTGPGGAGRLVLTVLVAVLACASLGWGARLTWAQIDALESVFARADQPGLAVSPLKPSALLNADRVNLMLLGLDSGQDNTNPTGPATDTIMVLSVDPASGDSVLLSMPRNTARMPFPPGSPLESRFPQGWFDGSTPTNPEFLLGAMYSGLPTTVDRNQLGPTEDLGADALKLSVGAALGLRVDYYVLIDLSAMAALIDALGGVTLDVNHSITTPDSLIEAGPQRHLDGATALAFARSIEAGDDYGRMARSRCLVQGVLSQTSPTSLLRDFIDVAAAADSGIRSDIPTAAVPQLIELADRVQRGNVISLQFTNNQNGFVASRPNFQRVAEQVQEAIELSHKPVVAPAPSEDRRPMRTADPRPLPEFCAYDPDSDW